MKSLKMTSRKRNMVLAMLLAYTVLICTVLLSTVSVFADVTSTSDYAQAVYDEIAATYADTKYETTGGGTFVYSDLMLNTDTSHNNIYVINEVNFNRLTSKGKTDFMKVLTTCAEKVVANDTAGTYSEESTNNWYKILQTQDGVGTKFLNVLLDGTKPDFVTAKKIFQPFQGIIGTVLGVGAVAAMSLIAVVEIADILYIGIPPMRMLVPEDGDKKKTISKIISHDAIWSVKQAEENDSGDGSPKQAFGLYFKRRIVALLLLAICLMYLVQGQIYVAIGWLLDLVSGFLGF